MRPGRANPYQDSPDDGLWSSPDGRRGPDPYDGRDPLTYGGPDQSLREGPDQDRPDQDRTIVIVLGVLALLLLFVPMIATSLAITGSFVFGGVGSIRSLLVALVLAGVCAIAGLMSWIMGLMRTPDRRPPLAWLGVIGMVLPQLLWPIGLHWWI